ncbi:MAG: helix-turn-helix transcriptional regulator, partial [Cyanobacteria bacterium P01_A01_bin.135]
RSSAMESQIDFVDSQTLTPDPNVTAGRVIASSQDLPWDGIYLEKGENEGFTPDNVTVRQHYFAMNTGPAFDWEWKDGRRFKTHRYETGDLWVNPAGVPFSHRIEGHNQFLLLTLDPQKMAELLPEQPLLTRQFRRQHRTKDRHLQALMQALLVEAELGGPNGRLYADTLSTAIATHFVNHYGIDGPFDDAALTPMDRQRLGRVVAYIEASLTTDLSLADLALAAGLSKYHFLRLFKQATGVTPHKYLLSRRVEQAAQLLKQGKSISQVAHQFGFADQSHFTRVFKRVKAMTPRQFVQAQA